MEDKTLVFDDWAMYLLKRWLTPEFVDTRGGAKRHRFAELLTYLCLFLQYDVPRHRYGFSRYLTITPDASQYEAILRISSYVVSHDWIPTEEDLHWYLKLGEEMASIETLIVEAYFAARSQW